MGIDYGRQNMKMTQADVKALDRKLAAEKVAKFMGGSTLDGPPLAGMKYTDQKMKSVFIAQYKTWAK